MYIFDTPAQMYSVEKTVVKIKKYDTKTRNLSQVLSVQIVYVQDDIDQNEKSEGKLSLRSYSFDMKLSNQKSIFLVGSASKKPLISFFFF